MPALGNALVRREHVRKEHPFSPILPSFLLTFQQRAGSKEGENSHGPHVWRRPSLIALVGSAEGPCVQGGEPLVGGRGMVAYAKCLWTVRHRRIGASRDLRGEQPAAGRGDSSASHRDDEGQEAPRAAFGISHPRLRKHYAWRRRTSPSALNRPRHRFRAVTLTRTRQQSRSLSYLSLTLCCAALRSGWLEGCATPLSDAAHWVELKFP